MTSQQNLLLFLLDFDVVRTDGGTDFYPPSCASRLVSQAVLTCDTLCMSVLLGG